MAAAIRERRPPCLCGVDVMKKHTGEGVERIAIESFVAAEVIERLP